MKKTLTICFINVKIWFVIPIVPNNFFWSHYYDVSVPFFKLLISKNLSEKDRVGGFPGGSVVKNPPADAEDTSWIPGRGGPHMPGSHKPLRHNYWPSAHEPPGCNYWSPLTLEALPCNRRSHFDEDLAHCKGELRLLAATREKPAQQRRHGPAKNTF